MTTRFSVVIPAVLLLPALALGGGCKKSGPETAKAATAAPSSPAPGGTTAAAPASPAPGGTTAAAPAPPKPVPAVLPDVIARINGRPVTKAEFEFAVRNLEAQAGGPVPAERRDAIYRQVLDQIVGVRLLLQEAEARGISVPQADVDGRIAQIRKQFPDEQAFKAALAQRQSSPEKLVSDIREQLSVMKLVEVAVTPQVVVGDEQLKKYYTDNPERFQQPEAVQVAHVLIRVPEKADAAARRKARAEAEQVRAAAFRGEDFAALARQHSMDQGSAARGGDLGFLARGQSVPAFEEAAFSLKPGQVSQVVETTFGFHVIKAGEHREARKVPLEEVKGEVTDYLKQQQVQEKTAALVEQLKAKGKVEILI